MIKNIDNQLKEHLNKIKYRKEKYENAMDNELEKNKLYIEEKQKINELYWISNEIHDILIKELISWLKI